MHPLTSMDVISPELAAKRIALVREIVIGLLIACVVAGLPTLMLYGLLQVLALSQ